MRRIIHKAENILNVPNVLSFYRLIISPLILFFVLSGEEKLFVVFICISLVSDVLDGNIARIFKLQTRFGAALDNLADLSAYVVALAGIFRFKWVDLEPHAWVIYLFVGTLLLSYLIAFLRFHKIPGLHLYLAVSSGYVQGVFIFTVFVFDFFPWMLYTAAIWGTIAYIEKIIVLLRLDDIRSGVKGLYWLLHEQRKISKN